MVVKSQKTGITIDQIARELNGDILASLLCSTIDNRSSDKIN